jgi:hypothetical protein
MLHEDCEAIPDDIQRAKSEGYARSLMTPTQLSRHGRDNLFVRKTLLKDISMNLNEFLIKNNALSDQNPSFWVCF